MILRDYQIKAIDDVTTAAAEGHRRILLQLPTGSGKTVIAAQIMRHSFQNGHHSLFLTHRREILQQTCDKLEAFGVQTAVMLSGDAYDPTRQCVVASIPTFHSWCLRRKKEWLPKADVVFFDECHHTPSKTWGEIAALFPEAFIIGLTATPCSKSGKGLAAHFDKLIGGPSVSELIEQGYLVRPRYIVPSPVDLAGLHVRAGDFIESELENRFDKPDLVGDIAQNWLKYGQERQTLIYAINIKHSLHIAHKFNELGIPAAHIDGKTDKELRDETIHNFLKCDSSCLKVITSVGVFTEGIDLPAASCIVLARPTRSLGLYFQIVGRGLRPFPGKEDVLVIDHAGAVYEHGRVEDPVEWSLTYNKGFDANRVKLRKERKRCEIICANCKTIYTKRIDCPNCGTKPEMKGQPVLTYEAWLKFLDEADIERPEEPKAWYLGLRNYARSKGWKDGWAAHKYKEKFGKWPAGIWKHLPDTETPIEVAAWIKTTQDQYWLLRKLRENRTRSWKGAIVPDSPTMANWND